MTPSLLLGVVVVLLLLWFGVHQFRKTEKSYADFI